MFNWCLAVHRLRSAITINAAWPVMEWEMTFQKIKSTWINHPIYNNRHIHQIKLTKILIRKMQIPIMNTKRLLMK